MVARCNVQAYHQLAISKPMPSQQLNVRVSDEEADHLELLASRTDGILSKQAVVRLLIQQAIKADWDPLDSSCTLGVASGSEATTSKAVKAVTSSKKTFKKEVNQCLEQHDELIREFWASKGGSRGETAWKLLMTELTKLQQKHGDAVVAEQLHLAINGKWQGISATRYEQFKAPKGNTPAQPEFKHPAAREFRNGRFVDEESTDGGVLEGLF